VFKKKGFLIAGGFLILPELAESWVPLPDIPVNLAAIGKGFSAMFFMLATYEILTFVWKQAEVTKAVIYASLVGYLLLAVTWSYLYLLVEALLPGSFEAVAEIGREGHHMAFLYYSFVTITTLGYGDITPTTEIARSVTILEAVIGQLYMVVLVAWLVGMHVSRRFKP
jgi:hypothetical protein